MASFTKLVFLSALLSLGSAAPLRAVRQRQSAPAADSSTSFWTVPLTLQAQHESFDFDLTTSLAVPHSSVAPLNAVPSNCASFGNECSASFEAVSVTYGDCGAAWTVCRCSNANMTMDTIVERLGRVPVGLRRFVATVVVSPDVTTHAYTLTSGDLHMFGDTAVDTWVHESMHAFDWASSSPISHTQAWTDAIQSDTCIPDTYSATSAIEAFAQVGVLKVFSLANNGLPDGWSSGCMSNQLKFMDQFAVFDKQSLFGPTCAIEKTDPGARHTTPPTDTPPPANDNVTPTVLPSGSMASAATAPPTTATSAGSGARSQPGSSAATAAPTAKAGPKNAATATAIVNHWIYILFGVGFVVSMV